MFFPRKLWWLYPIIRCITVDRENPAHTAQGVKTVVGLLERGEVVVIHIEGGRTPKLPKGEEYLCKEERRLRPPKEGVAVLALKTGARVLPLYVEYNGSPITSVESPLSLLRRGMVLHVGDLYDPASEQEGRGRLQRITAEIARGILTA